MLPSPVGRGLGLRNHFLSRPPLGSLALRPGDSLTIPKMALSVGFIRFVSSTDATRATGLLTLTLVGLIPTDHVCLVWTHCLLKSPFSLRALMLRPTADTLLGDDVGVPVRSPDPANIGALARRPPARNPGVTAPAAGAATHSTAAAAARDDRPVRLGHALAPLDRVANGARHRQDARDIVPPQATRLKSLGFSAFGCRDPVLPGGAHGARGGCRADPSNQAPQDRPTTCCPARLACRG
jgi:hypothetical protein